VNAPIRIAALADWLHPTANLWKAMVMLKAYFDESGTHGDSAVVSISGLVARKDAWIEVSEKWQAILDEFKDRGVRWFRMSEALAQEGQFARIDKVALDYILTQLSGVLHDSHAVPLSSAVVREDWRAVVTDTEFLARFPDPIDLCFENIIRHLAAWSRQNAGGETVCPMFAYHQEFSPRMAEIGRLYGAQNWYRTVLGALAFDYPDRVIPLQCADLVAHQMNWDVEKRAYGPFDIASAGPTVVLHRATGGRFAHGNWYDAEGLRLTVKRFKETGAI